MNHGLKVNGNVLEITLPDGIDIEKVVVNGEVFGEEQNVPDTNVGDMISRQAAIDAINHICPIDTEYDCTLLDRKDVEYVLSNLPSAQQDVTEKLHQCKCYITDKKGLQHEVIYIDDIRRVTGWVIF